MPMLQLRRKTRGVSFSMSRWSEARSFSRVFRARDVTILASNDLKSHVSMIFRAASLTRVKAKEGQMLRASGCQIYGLDQKHVVAMNFVEEATSCPRELHTHTHTYDRTCVYDMLLSSLSALPPSLSHRHDRYIYDVERDAQPPLDELYCKGRRTGRRGLFSSADITMMISRLSGEGRGGSWIGPGRYSRCAK